MKIWLRWKFVMLLAWLADNFPAQCASCLPIQCASCFRWTPRKKMRSAKPMSGVRPVEICPKCYEKFFPA